jgi:hypothetical protein
LTCRKERDIENKLEKFNRTLRITNQVVHPANFENTQEITYSRRH